VLSLAGAAVLLTVRAVLPGLGAGASEGLAYAAVMLPLVALGLWRSRAARGLERITASMLPEDVLVPLAVVVIALAWPLASAPGAVAAWTVASVAALAGGTLWLVAVLPSAIHGVAPEFDSRLWLRVSVPMILGGLMQLAANRGDVVLLGLLRDMGETGVYVAAARVALLGTFALRVVDTYTAPMIAGAFHAGRLDEVRSMFSRGVAYSAAGALPLCLIALIWPEPLLRLFGDPFVRGATVLRILALGQLVNAATGPVGFTLLMTGHEKLFAGMMTAASGFGLVAGLLIIPTWGGEGAAVVAASTAAAVNVAMLVAVRRKVLGRGATVEPR
jgi:O-antigen/teichoic acid export membrane protein